MPKAGASNCSACLHWQPYPQIQGIGVCDDPGSMLYDRGVSSTGEPCERFAQRAEAQWRCGDCQDWYPLDVGPSIGECRNYKSMNFGTSVFWDRLSSDCFRERSLEKAEFFWCGTCRQTVHASERASHSSHKSYTWSSQLPVEEEMEFTAAGD